MNTLERTIRPAFIKMLESSPLKEGNIEVYNKALARAKTTNLNGLMIMAPLLGATNCKKFRTAVQAVLIFRANKSIRPSAVPPAVARLSGSLSLSVGSSRDLPPAVARLSGSLSLSVEEEIPFTFG